MKGVFIIKPVLAVLDLDKKFRVKANALNYVTREVLSIKCSDNLWRPVIFILKSLSDIGKNYKIHNKEMLVVIRCLEV